MPKEAILIVEKDATDRKVISDIVSDLAYPFQTASNSLEAIQLLDQYAFPMVILDIRCEADSRAGVMKGIQTTKKEDPPFVIMTGTSDDYSHERVFGAGAKKYIKKPFTPDQLEKGLKRIFHERQLSIENATLHKQQTELNEQLNTILSVASDLTSELDFDKLFPLIIGKITDVMNAERTSLYMINWEIRELWTRVSEGIHPMKIGLGDGISGRVAQSGEVICVEDAWELSYFNRDFDKLHNFRSRSILCIPIYNRLGERIAVIQTINKKDRGVFEEKDIDFLSALGSQVGIALENARLYDELRMSFNSFIHTLSTVVDARHPFTAGHSHRVTEYSLVIARQMNIEEFKIQVLKIAALLHDVGKIGVSDNVLHKSGPFTPEERQEMNTHPVKTKEILEKFHFPRAMKDIPKIALHHHEKVNGEGYPMGISGDQIPLESKIMAVADVFDALTSRRDYPKYSHDETFTSEPVPLATAIEILKNDAGSHFDPEVIDAFLICLPEMLLRFRGGHFPPEYVDDTIRELSPGLLNS
jgi:response regulator RpfG family c-di-GMP phosphodiesterase